MRFILLVNKCTITAFTKYFFCIENYFTYFNNSFPKFFRSFIGTIMTRTTSVTVFSRTLFEMLKVRCAEYILFSIFKYIEKLAKNKFQNLWLLPEIDAEIL